MFQDCKTDKEDMPPLAGAAGAQRAFYSILFGLLTCSSIVAVAC